MRLRNQTAGMLLCGVSALAVATPVAGQTPTFNYAEALQKAIFFYEEQISGQKPSWSRVTWRGDSALTDGQDVGHDLTGGWFDAGDHVKFGFAMAASATMLAWGGVEYRSAYDSKGQLTPLLNNLRWVNDYFIKAHTAPNELWGQVGQGDPDHSFWGPAEIMHLKTPRLAFKIDMSCPGSDLAAETAAAMAASSIVFRPTDPAYADTLVSHARQLFSFAQATHPSFYVDCVPGAPFYDSHFGNPNDEMTWAAVWLFRATSEASFLSAARNTYPTMCKETGTTTPCFTWTQNWNDKHFGTYVLMAKLTNEAQFHTDAQRWLDYWIVGTGAQTRTTPGGLMFVDGFGSLRYATNTAFIALVYADALGATNTLFPRYHDFAKKEVDYVLGANPAAHSYMGGFGVNPPRNEHHRTGHGSWVNGGPDGVPATNRHILYGAMVAGPDSQSDTAWTDSRSTFRNTEPATDMNAGFTGALARLAQEFGGTPLASFPTVETPDGPEEFVDAQINVQGTNFTEIRAFVDNRSAWPARNLNKGTFRYYFTLEPGVTPSQISVQSNFSQCGSGNVTGPTQLSGSTYFVTVSCVGTDIFPGGQSEHRREIQFRITSAGAWDPTNDYSFQGLSTSAAVTTNRIVLFDNGVRVWGTEPVTTPDFTLSANPASVTVVRGATAQSTITVAPTGGFASAVALTASALPTGVTATFNPASTTGTSALTFSASATATTGPATVTVTGTGGGLTRTTTIALTVQPPATPDFSLSAAPTSVSVAQGASGQSTVTIARLNGFTSAVALSASPLPTGVTATFNPASATGTSSTLTFAASATAALGTTTVTVTGAGGGLTRTTTVSLTVGPAADFSLSVPATLSVAQGASSPTTVTIARTGGFAGAVALSASPLPAGVTATFNPTSATGTTSTLTFAASATATTGTTSVTVTGTSGTLTRTTSLSLTVAPATTGTGGVTVTPVINQNTPWFNEEDVRLDNTAPLTALSLTIVVQRTTGVSFNGQYNTVGSQIQQANGSTTAAITYTFTLAAGQSLGAGNGKLFAAQSGGSGTLHPTAGDTFTVTYTTGGQSFTQSGHF